jgi:hypothetical protein
LQQKNKIILLLPATVLPFPGMPNNQRSDPRVRLSDYKIALTNYLSLPKGPPDEIFFVDNSGYALDELDDLGEIAKVAGRKLRVLSIAPSRIDCKSKPYGELDIQDQAHLAISSCNDEDAIIWKVTGRLFVSNIQQLMGSFRADAGLYCDLRQVPLIGNALGGNPWFDMRLWAYRSSFYAKHFFDVKTRIPLIDELAMYGHVCSLIESEEKLVPRFKIQPEFIGHCAANNADYTTAPMLLKHALRRFTRKYAPFVWI